VKRTIRPVFSRVLLLLSCCMLHVPSVWAQATAVITRSGQTQILAGITRLQFSGMDSYAIAPGDAVQHIARWDWDYSDGSREAGAHVSHNFISAGTYTVTLTVFSDNGASATATTSVVVAPTPSFSGFTLYVSESGDDSHSGLSDADALATLEAAFYKW